MLAALAPPPSKQADAAASLELAVTSKQPRNQLIPLDTQNSFTNKLNRQPTLRQNRTKPIVWFAAVLCLIFSLVLIFFGIATLILYLSFKPRNPSFDIPNASLNVVYFDSPQYFNGDFILLANFSNPNSKIHVRFESLDIELFFSDRLISSQSMKPFSQRPKERRLQSVNFLSSLVFLPQDFGVKFQKQVQNNRISYNVRGTFKVRFNMGLMHRTYWLHSVCQMDMTGPPTGVLVARQCTTTR